jgi:GntR family transcriptional regulator
VARAYRELEAEDLVEKRRTAGTFISSGGTRLTRPARVKIVAQRVDVVLAEARQLGITVDEVVELVRRRDQAMQRGKGADGS